MSHSYVWNAITVSSRCFSGNESKRMSYSIVAWCSHKIFSVWNVRCFSNLYPSIFIWLYYFTTLDQTNFITFICYWQTVWYIWLGGAMWLAILWLTELAFRALCDTELHWDIWFNQRDWRLDRLKSFKDCQPYYTLCLSACVVDCPVPMLLIVPCHGPILPSAPMWLSAPLQSHQTNHQPLLSLWVTLPGAFSIICVICLWLVSLIPGDSASTFTIDHHTFDVSLHYIDTPIM